ncbi:MAG: hypothetical protein O3A58_04070 [Proteobacteria bacterium]|nr:hypothetical protein [Pseudomonadota bacterium]
MTTDKIKDLSAEKKIHITEQPNDLLNIVCRAIFGECSTKIIEPGKKIDAFIDEYKALVLSSVSKENCTLAYKKHLQSKCSFYLLQHSDFNENTLDNDAIFRLTFYNLELFRIKSVRAKSKFLAKTTVDQIEKGRYSNIINQNLIDKFPLWYLHFYRVIAFKSNGSLHHMFSELNGCDKEDFPSLLDSILPFVFYTDSPILFCNILSEYYADVYYKEDVNKFLVFLILTKFHERLDKQTFQKINSTALADYCTSVDTNGDHLKTLEKFVNELPLVSKNLHTIFIVTYAKIFHNEKYDRLFSKKIEEPSNKLESVYYDVLLKVDIILQRNEANGIPPLELKKGVDQYRCLLQDKITPDQPSPFFNLLLDRSTAR